MCFFSVLKALVVFAIHTPTSGFSNLRCTDSIANMVFSADQKTPSLVDPKHFLNSDANNPRDVLFSTAAPLLVIC